VRPRSDASVGMDTLAAACPALIPEPSNIVVVDALALSTKSFFVMLRFTMATRTQSVAVL